MREVYFDNSSTSFPKAPGVGKAIAEFLERGGYNVGRGGYNSSYSLAGRVLDTRIKLKDFFGFDSENNVIFTPNVTFALNYIIHGLLKAGDELVITSMEHNAVARPAVKAGEQGVKLKIADCDEKGRLDFDNFKNLLTPETKAVIMLHGSNVSGALMPLKEVGRLCEEKGIFFIVDVAQTGGIFPINMKEMSIDGLAFTGHKGLLGPQGIGGLILGDRLAKSILPIIEGGTGSSSDSVIMPDFMPDKLEAGTLNLPGIIGLSAALDHLAETGIDEIRIREMQLTNLFMAAFEGRKDVRIIGPEPGEERCPIVSLDFTEMDNAELAFRLDSEYGIMVRCGLHCAPLAHKTLGTFPQGTVRFSFSQWNTEEETEYAVDAIERILGNHSG